MSIITKWRAITSAGQAKLLLILELAGEMTILSEAGMTTLSEAAKLPVAINNLLTCRATSPTEWMSKVVSPDSTTKLQHTLAIESALEELKTCDQWELT